MEEGPDMEMRGVAEMGMGEFAESREKGGVSRRGGCRRPQLQRFLGVETESKSKPRRKPGRPLERGQPGCSHEKLLPGLS